MVDDGLKSLGAPAVPSQDGAIESLAENAAPAKNSITPKSAGQYHELHPSPAKGQICRPTGVSALNAPALSPAAGTYSPRSTRSKQDLHPVPDSLHRINCETIRREARALKTMIHPLILP